MKKHVSLSLIIFLAFSTITSHAKIWRVNNQAGINADFTLLQAAHDGAAGGDTLHLEGSPTTYGGLSCTKKLVIIGAGYFLDENANSQAITQSSKVGQVYFYTGSSGSVIMGLDFQASGLAVYEHNIIIRRNKFTSPGNNQPDWSIGTIGLHYQQNNSSIPVTNIIISQNYGVIIDVNYASTGVLITNNFICRHGYEGEATAALALSVQANAITLVQNNIFRRGRVSANNSSFTNNIMIAGSFDGTGNLVANNMGNGAQFGTTNGNKQNVDMASVFLAAGSTDGQWKLKAGSPAIGAGYGSTQANPVDAGMYSGQSAYMLAGLPPVPSIYFFENQPIGSNTDPIDVSIKVKSNN
jgi:hypothetical protein